ncbi:MAG: hypothetical protein PHX61_09035, partial [Alphaproteobacteria bacterium]|nr:hypothetical protein [Alphaproteobacteria bacterium]
NLSYAGTLNVVGNNSPLATMDGTASSFAGCNAGGQGPGGYYVACGVAGSYNLIVTPSGCSGGVTNPTCAGGVDTVALAHEVAATVNGTSTATLLMGSFTSTGAINTANQIAYSGGVFDFPAANYCNGLVYGGYDDWFLPSSSELSYLYANKSAVGSATTGTYWSSFSTPTSTWPYYIDISNGVISGQQGTGVRLIRCMRRDPAYTETPTPDSTPITMTFNPSYGAAGETRTSNTVTIYGVTVPVSVSVSGTGAQFSINGGAYTSTAATATNGDTITLQATSPALGQESIVSLTTGTISTNWLVRTPGNNTIRVFTTSVGYAATTVNDANCTSIANAAGLPGTWIVMASSGSSGIINKLPWNWKYLKNMNGQTVATSVADFMDGTISAPLSYSQTGGAVGPVVSWTGLNASAGTNTGSCYGWTNTSATGNVGAVSATTGGGYFWNGGGVWGCATTSPAIVCIESNAAGTDLDPNAVSIRPQVTFASGGTGTSNTVTISGVTDVVAVSIVPDAGGTADIIKGGFSEGATTTTAGLNETLAFTLTAPTVLGTKNTATITIGPDTYTWWVGYADSAREAKVFVTSTTYQGNLGGLSGADSICNGRAAASSYGLSSKWKAILSGSTMDAANRIPWNWGTLRNMVGDAVVDGGFPDLWDGTLDMPILYSETGTQPTGTVRTTTHSTGNWNSGKSACSNYAAAESNWESSGGLANQVNYNWANYSEAACSYSYPIYCIEDIDNAVADTTPNTINLTYAIQVATSSRQTSSAVTISGMSVGATATLAVSATGGDPKFTVNGGAEVTSASITNGDSVVFLMDAPATDNDFNKMTITVGTMTSYWRVWTGDSTGTVVKRVFITSATYGGAGLGGVIGADAKCQSQAGTAALGGTWKALISGVQEENWAVNRIGYNWTKLTLVDGTDVIYAGNLWSSTPSLLSPIVRTQAGAIKAGAYAFTNTTVLGAAKYQTSGDGYNCNDWTGGSQAPHGGASSSSTTQWIDNGTMYAACQGGYGQSLYCIEQ